MDVEDQLSTVLKEKRRLSAELAKCTADKEFVWTLWKQLQTSSPDLSSAVSLIVTREKEKAERKDKRILEIFQAKDARLLQLEEALIEKSNDLRRTRQEHAAQADALLKFESQVSSQSSHIEEMGNQLAQCRDECDSTVSSLQVKIGALVNEKSVLGAKLEAVQSQAKEKVAEKAEEVQLKNRFVESLQTEVSERMGELSQKSEEIVRLVEAKESLECELAFLKEEQERMQTDHQEKAVAMKEEKNQLISHAMQKTEELAQSRKETDTLKQEIALCNTALETEKKNQRQILVELRDQREAYSQLETSVGEAQQRNAKEMAAKNHEVILLQSKIRSLERDIATMPHPSLVVTKDAATSPFQFSRPSLEGIQRELEHMKRQLEARDYEVGELRSAQSRRLKRLKSLQREHRLVLEQLKTYERFETGTKAMSPPSPSPRATAKELQQEDSDSVWNELNYYRTQYTSLLEEKTLMDEECNVLRVRVMEQERIILDLRQCLENERDDLMTQIDVSEMKSGLEIEATNQEHVELIEKKANALHTSVVQLEEDKQRLIASRKEQQAECFGLREQVASLHAQLLRKTLDTENKGTQCRPSVTSSGIQVTEIDRGKDDSDGRVRKQISNVSVQVNTSCLPVSPANCPRYSKAVQTEEDRKCDGNVHSRSKSAGMFVAFGGHFNPTENKKKEGAVPRFKSDEKVRLLQQRIASLTRQLTVVQKAKAAGFRALEEQKHAYKELRAAHSSCKQKEEMLTHELESRRSEKVDLKRTIAEFLAQQQVTASLASSANTSHHTESEWKHLEQRAKAASEECVRQGKLLRSLKADLQDQEAQQKTMQERCNRLDRNVSRKQSLIDDLKAKLKVYQKESEEASDRVKAVENKLEAADDIHEQRKSRLQALKIRIAKEVEEKEKLLLERRQLREETAKKDERFAQLQAKCHRTETALAQTTQKTKETVEALESRYSGMVKALEDKVKQSRGKLDEFQAFTRAYGQELIGQVREARLVRKEAVKLSAAAGATPDGVDADFRQSGNWSRAKKLSCSILNLSEADFMDFMFQGNSDSKEESAELLHSKNDGSDLEKQEKHWWKNVESLSKTKPPFAVALMELFVTMTEERLRLLLE
eukprot:m.88116 g.88116  ORF g.88116 m.88116 type:complete len:1114 (+) comp36562_c0_seq3:122-3463(+)